MARTDLSADSLAAYVKVVLGIRDRWHREDKAEEDEPDKWRPTEFWYRGQASARWKLKPRLYRLKRPDEPEIHSEFQRRSQQLTSEPNLPHNAKEFYFLMQHFGAPTRLLDWTDGALLGLYFAIRSQKRPRDAAVWMLDPEWLNGKTLGEDEHGYVEGILLPDWKESAPWFPVPFEDSLLALNPVAIDPPHVARRVAVQHSHFTVHGRLRNGLDRLARDRRGRLVKITIPKRGIEQIRRSPSPVP